MPVITVSEGHTLSLPREVMDHLALKPGDEITCLLQDGAVVLRPLPRAPHSLSAPQHDASRLDTPLRFLHGVGPRLSQLLERLDLRTVEDALLHLPHRYDDRRTFTPIASLRPGSHALILGTVTKAGAVSSRGGKRLFEAVVQDDSGPILLKWFRGNTGYLSRVWQPGKRCVVSGEVTLFGLQAEIHHPEAEWVDNDRTPEQLLAADPLSFGALLPVYHLTEGVGQKVLRKLLRQVVDQYADALYDTIPPDIAARHGLLTLADSIRQIHQPPDEADREAFDNRRTRAHHTLVFDEFFHLQLGMALKRRGVVMEEGISFQVTHRYTRELLKLLPFSLTSAQRRVLTEIKTDMMSPHPMLRLVQGDVGSGKTMVALMAALVAVENGCQVAIMAPTEILAEQHYLNIHGWCDQLGIRVALITSSLKGKRRAETLADLAAGSIRIVIGTHAVIQDKVDFARLGLGIVDEQHRFGVLQRSLLRKKGVNPDILVMTATPIPRTLAMTVFGDLAISVIDEMPPGRHPVETRVIPENGRQRAYDLIASEAAQGRQAYIIYPLVEESEKSELKAATQMAEHLARDVFPSLRVGLLHGRMKPEEKEAVMACFKRGELDVLVATTVIEVGIDVPNATIILVEHAERFGLSQLHQLRGRVGRGEGKSRCLLLAADRVSEEGRRRLQVMAETCDGFRIAEADLDIRGPGDFLGTRQAGLPDFRVASILRDARILEAARQEAFALVEKEPAFEERYPALCRELLRRWGGRLELAATA
jgi:ATP-dependent DNA helicase RecG